MSGQDITIVDFGDEYAFEVVGLLRAQEARLRGVNGLIAGARTFEQIKTVLDGKQMGEKRGWVARGKDGRVRGYARAGVWELDEESILLSFLTGRNGVTEVLVLPDPGEAGALEVVEALVERLDAYWREMGTTGDLVRWPSGDRWFEEVLARYGFQLDSVCARRGLQPAFEARGELVEGLRTRMARPEDEEALVALFDEELRFHERYTPFVHTSAGVLQAFRRKLGRAWRQEQPKLGEPFVLVIEQGGDVVAMAENSLITVGEGDEPGYTPAGHYCCIDNMSVRRDWQGRGLGHALLHEISAMIRPLAGSLRGYVLWYNPDNPSAARFWARQGFEGMWSTYQRVRSVAGEG